MTIENKELSIEEAFGQLSGINDVDGDLSYADDIEVEETEDTSATDDNPAADEDAGLDTESTDTEETPAGTAADASGDADWKAQANYWEQKFKSFEGRIRAEQDTRKLEMQQQLIEALKDRQPATKQEDPKEELPKNLKEFYEEFPDIATAVEDLLNRRINETKRQMETDFEQRLLPVMAEVQTQKNSTHLDRILARHPDAIEVRKSTKFEMWLNTLPTTMKIGANAILSSGSSQEVNDLLDQYKELIRAKTANQPTEKKTNAADPGVSKSIIEQAKGGFAVPSSKSQPPKTDKKADNYDAAWEEAVKALGL